MYNICNKCNNKIEYKIQKGINKGYYYRIDKFCKVCGWIKKGKNKLTKKGKFYYSNAHLTSFKG